MKPVRLIVAGAGSRGHIYASFALEHPDRLKIVGVAEPRREYRERMVAEHGIPAGNVFEDWRAMADAPRLADGVIVATQDAMHVEPALAFAERGYHLLLEKPMAPTAIECRRIAAGVKAAGVLFAVCHVLRYTAYTRRLMELLEGGAIGELMSAQHLEPVGYWHQAHSFVRGNWRREDEAAPMLLAKSCHDLDWIRHVVGAPCRAVSSFGSLTHFRREAMPEGATERCLDCPVEGDCPYSAKKIYLGFAERGVTGWPLDVLTPEPTRENLLTALRDGPYGRCVYDCDNDVVDHQVVNMEFEGGATAAFTMTAFTQAAQRKTRLFGTRGELEGAAARIRVHDFMSDSDTEHDIDATAGALVGHGGGDHGLMDAFVGALETGDASRLLSGATESLESHLMVFAAERARREGRVVTMGEMG